MIYQQAGFKLVFLKKISIDVLMVSGCKVVLIYQCLDRGDEIESLIVVEQIGTNALALD